jgi:hypothetical protein
METKWKEEFSKCFQKYCAKSWSALLGVPLETVHYVYLLLSLYFPCATKRDLLLALNFLKEYRTEAAASTQFNISLNNYNLVLWETLHHLDICLPPVSISSYTLILAGP